MAILRIPSVCVALLSISQKRLDSFRVKSHDFIYDSRLTLCIYLDFDNCAVFSREENLTSGVSSDARRKNARYSEVNSDRYSE